MDFHSLNRRQLQSLCKLNKIPANITNVAMADALQSLQSVEGIEEFLNPVPSSEMPNEIPGLMSPVTSFRTSTRPKVKKSYADFGTATTTRGVKKQVAVGANDGVKTQAVASTRKKASETSSSQTMAAQDTAKKVVATVQRAYSTRRSTRLTEKKCAETGVLDRKDSQPVKIGSFLEEEDSGNLVSEKSLGSEISHESDISFENTKDSVAEESVESFSKAKVEDICNMFDNVDLEESQNEGDKFVLNKVVNAEEENSYVGSEEHSDSLLSDKASFVSESSTPSSKLEDISYVVSEMKNEPLESSESNTPSLKLEDISYVVSEMKHESLESSGSKNMARDYIHLNNENLSELSKSDNPDSNYVAKEVSEEGMDFGPPAEEHVIISNSQVDAVLDYPNPEDSSMISEAYAEDEKEDTVIDMDADKVTQDLAADNANDAVEHSIHLSPLKQQTIRDSPTPLKGMSKVGNDENSVTELQGAIVEDNRSVNKKAEEEKADTAVDMDAGNVTQEPATDNANDAVDCSYHLSAMKQQTIRDDPTSLIGVTKVGNDENSVTELEVATVEDNRSVDEKDEDEKPKLITELSLRQLKKQLKALTIKSNDNTNKDNMVAEARPALQVVCDNQMVTGEDH